MSDTRDQKKRRHARVRAKVQGTVERPRLSVFRSNKYVYAQLIDDARGHTLISSNEKELKESKKTQKERAEKVGENLAKKALAKKIKKAVFDKGEYKYTGNIKALAESARKEGLVF